MKMKIENVSLKSPWALAGNGFQFYREKFPERSKSEHANTNYQRRNHHIGEVAPFQPPTLVFSIKTSLPNVWPHRFPTCTFLGTLLQRSHDFGKASGSKELTAGVHRPTGRHLKQDFQLTLRSSVFIWIGSKTIPEGSHYVSQDSLQHPKTQEKHWPKGSIQDMNSRRLRNSKSKSSRGLI